MGRSGKMMMFVWLASAAVFAGACGGGSSDFCHLGSKMSGCAGSTVSSCSSSDVAACETAIGSCSNADQSTLNNYANCIANQGGCSSSGDWVKIAEHCMSEIEGVSSATACLETISKAAPSCGG